MSRLCCRNREHLLTWLIRKAGWKSDRAAALRHRRAGLGADIVPFGAAEIYVFFRTDDWDAVASNNGKCNRRHWRIRRSVARAAPATVGTSNSKRTPPEGGPQCILFCFLASLEQSSAYSGIASFRFAQTIRAIWWNWLTVAEMSVARQSVQQRAVRRHLVELVQGRSKVGVILVDDIEGEFLVELKGRRTKRRRADLNAAVGELVRMGDRRRIAAEIRVEGEAVVARSAERRRCKRRRRGGCRGRDGRWRHGMFVGSAEDMSAPLAAPDPSTTVESVRCSLSSRGTLGATILSVSTFRSEDNRVWVTPPFDPFVSAPIAASLELPAAA
jgi:hypothetical protein